MILIPGMPTPDTTSVLVLAIGIGIAMIGIISWKLGQKKKAKLEPKDKLD